MSPPTPCQVLDPSTLGRPVHRLGRFTECWREDLAQLLGQVLNRRWRAGFELGKVSIERSSVPADAGRWNAFAAEAGSIACAVERPLLLTLLALRYGGRSAATDPQTLPPTATEDRLASSLAQQFVEALAGRIQAGLDGAPYDIPSLAWRATAALLPRGPAWIARVQLIDRQHGVDASLRLLLDDAWMDRLLACLPAPRARNAEHGAADSRPLSQRLRLTLTARLLEKEMPLGDLLDLRVGDLIPVRLGPTEVRVDDARLYTATVAEHQGKLCLTSFADAD
ncbi:FliM/FliN family flagellar motor C-terminal domain-containing protein [Eleftheria terrae]|uniref:FliM/FliN family flagellar motor C-terminal domain-containing protein n=1 Tax=Eleftheria terrae TaxID=1597781 RepID=UPI00263B54FB|nr:FliM/FliN family flagellar motor C-terminal domain-containing protein [Eleftheria terrae]WKB54118.1 FliM/FliN family flagellar motor C-terminal domain-containing protein [Eleftheria terrae]